MHYPIHDFATELKAALGQPLPGEDAQYEMAPLGRADRVRTMKRGPNPRLSAVLVLLYPFEAQVHTVLMLRNAYPGVHSGQVSFPGGKHEEEDDSMLHTALREAEEEVGVPRNAVEVIGRLTEIYIPPSGFLVEPVVGYTETRPAFVPDPGEVQELIEVPVSTFLDDANIKEKPITMSGGFRLDTPYFDVNGHVVWGATAMMLAELRAVIQASTLPGW